MNPKSFDYSFLATLDERGQGIPTMGIEEWRERVTNARDLNYDLVKR